MILEKTSASLAEATLVVKVVCPNDDKLQKMITTQAKDENFLVQCANPGPGNESLAVTASTVWSLKMLEGLSISHLVEVIKITPLVYRQDPNRP